MSINTLMAQLGRNGNGRGLPRDKIRARGGTVQNIFRSQACASFSSNTFEMKNRALSPEYGCILQKVEKKEDGVEVPTPRIFVKPRKACLRHGLIGLRLVSPRYCVFTQI